MTAIWFPTFSGLAVPSPGAAPAFSPADIASLYQWIDAQDASSITKNGSNLVTQWDDKSGNEAHWTQGNTAHSPTYVASGINGHPAVTFAAATGLQNMTLHGRMLVANRDKFSVIMVLIPTVGAVAYAQEYYIWYACSGSNWRVRFSLANHSTDGRVYGNIRPANSAQPDGLLTLGSTPILEVPTIMRLDVDPAGNFYGLYKAEVGTPPNLWSGQLPATVVAFDNIEPYCSDIGAGQAYIGTDNNPGADFQLGEFLAFSDVLSATDLASVTSYLKDKWSFPNPWTPASLAGIYSWYDAQNAASITKDGSDNVTQWSDLANTAAHLTRTGTDGPLYVASNINSKPALRFSASKGLLNSTNAGLDFLRAQSRVTIIMVMLQTTRDNGLGYYYWSNGASSQYTRLSMKSYASAGRFQQGVRQSDGASLYTDYTSGSYPIPASEGVIHRLDMDYASRYPKQYLSKYTAEIQQASQLPSADSVADTRSLASSIGGAGENLGSGSAFDLGELIMVRGTLSALEILNLEAYLKAKWGIT